MKKRDRGSSRALLMQGMLSEQEQSGLSLSAFARKKGIAPSTLWYWRKGRRQRQLRGKRKGQRLFLPVRVLPDQPQEFLIVEVGQGRRIHVPLRFEEESLRRLIGVVESC